MPDQPIATLPSWVLTEPVDVTRIYSADSELLISFYLVERVDVPAGNNVSAYVPQAVVLMFNEAIVEMNGLPVDLGEDLMAVCSLVDDAGYNASPDGVAPIGLTVRTEPYQEK